MSTIQPVIQVQGLSKEFIIAHEAPERYTALRDVVSRRVKKVFALPFKKKQLNGIPSKESFWALKNIDFSINAGDRLGIIGRNGAGKSTLLKILSRITEPTEGIIRIRGRVASLLEVGTGFHPELTGRENIYLNGAILGMSRVEIRRKFDEIVDFAEVEKFLDTPVKRYSSGMYVRLAFAVAAHLEPEILIVDEVLAVGDAQFQKKCLGKMEDVSKNEGRTVIFVSHNMPTILNLCKTCIYLDNGRIREMGETSHVVSNYMKQDGNVQTEYTIAPGSSITKKALPFFELKRFYLRNKKNIDSSVIQADSKLELEVVLEGVAHEVDIRFNLGFALKNEFGDDILMSFSTDQPEDKWLKFDKGPVTISTFIDTSILNEGKYYIYLLASLHCVKMLYTSEDNICLGFEVVGNRGNSPYWINKRNSILAPYIAWTKA